MSNPLTVDLTVREEPVEIGDKKYLLKEANGDASARYRNFLFSQTKLGPGGKPQSIGSMADAEPLLVSLCLWEPGEKENQCKRVDLALVKSWPSRVVKALYNKAKEMSDLDEEEDKAEPIELVVPEGAGPGDVITFDPVTKEVKAKNSSSDTDPGSG